MTTVNHNPSYVRIAQAVERLLLRGTPAHLMTPQAVIVALGIRPVWLADQVDQENLARIERVLRDVSVHGRFDLNRIIHRELWVLELEAGLVAA